MGSGVMISSKANSGDGGGTGRYISSVGDRVCSVPTEGVLKGVLKGVGASDEVFGLIEGGGVVGL